MEPQHVDPEQAVRIHQDVQSRTSLAIHWGTFSLANEVRMLFSYFVIDPWGG